MLPNNTKITAELLERARAIASDHFIFTGYLTAEHDHSITEDWRPTLMESLKEEGVELSKCLCGIGLLLKADGKNPKDYTLTKATEELGIDQDYRCKYTWLTFDDLGRGQDFSKAPDVYNTWLDEMDRVFVQGEAPVEGVLEHE